MSNDGSLITGFPSPAQGYEDKAIDLNSLLIMHPAATVFMQIDSSRYVRMGIYRGDILIIDRALAVNDDSLVIYERDGEFRLGKISLLKVDEENGLNVCGTVTHVIHTVRSCL